jgi:DNA repair protein RecO (recombination protein O)
LDYWTFRVPVITDTAICIRRWDFSETSQTVSLLTREHGIIRGLAKGAKREKGNFSGGLDVLTRGEVIANVKPPGTGRELALITAWHLQDLYRVLRQSLRANRAALYMADLVHHMLEEQDPHPGVFDALAAALEELNDPSSVEPALLRFQWALLSDAGYQPELMRDAQSGAALPNRATLEFNPRAGGLVSASQGEGWRVRRETVATLRAVAAGDSIAPHDEESVRRANRLLAAYCREIIGSEPPAMRWAFPDVQT